MHDLGVDAESPSLSWVVCVYFVHLSLCVYVWQEEEEEEEVKEREKKSQAVHNIRDFSPFSPSFREQGNDWQKV